jgi:hypothetical protein
LAFVILARKPNDIPMINLGEDGHKNKMIIVYRISITDDTGTRVLIRARINKSFKLLL